MTAGISVRRNARGLTLAAAACAGLVFGVGLIVSGMANPAKVLGFLDVAGAWDPSLALVMAGAVAVGALGFHAASQREEALLGERVRLPETRRIDARLVGGSLLFGVGWGIAGLCPGPALVILGIGGAKIVLFVTAMLAGMLAFEGIERRTARNAQAVSGTDNRVTD